MRKATADLRAREREKDAAELRASAAQAEADKGSSASQALSAAKRVRPSSSSSCMLHDMRPVYAQTLSAVSCASGQPDSLVVCVVLTMTTYVVTEKAMSVLTSTWHWS